MRKLYALSIVLVISVLATSAAQAHQYPRPNDFPFTGNLEKREAWQEEAIKHAKLHLKQFQGTSYILAANLTKKSKGPHVNKEKGRLATLRSELKETRETLAVWRAALREAMSSPVGVVSSGGCGDDGTYNFNLQFADFWLCKYPWLDNTIASQIKAAEIIGSQSAGDPWPNCPDPYDGSGASWEDTADCESDGWDD